MPHQNATPSQYGLCGSFDIPFFVELYDNPSEVYRFSVKNTLLVENLFAYTLQ